MHLNQILSAIGGLLLGLIPVLYVYYRQSKCALCAKPWVKTAWKEEELSWEGVRGTVEVPVRTCRHCGESYTDYVAEKIRDGFVADTKKKLAGHRVTRIKAS